MRSIFVVAGAVLGISALLVSSLPAGAETPDATAQLEGTGGEFVVGYDGSAADAAAAIGSAGGAVVDVNEAIGVALVTSPDAAFLETVRAVDGVTGAARNHSVGTAGPGMPHRFVEDRPSAFEPTAITVSPLAASKPGKAHNDDPLANLQWDMAMIGATANGAHRRSTGRKVTVGIIDTGIDASHPDIAPNFSRDLSRNFTTDIPAIDGPCEAATCVDPVDVDEGGRGTHVAGIVGAARNGLGIAGAAPDATLVNVRAGQDSGYFFLYETVAALTYAADARLDVVNLSFFVDPWLYNCDSADQYVSGAVNAEQIAEQAFARQTLIAALEYAHARGVTLVGAAGDQHADLAAPTRVDPTSPTFPVGSAQDRIVTNDCLSLPHEGPHVIQVSSVGPSTTKSDFSNYGSPGIEVAAPGGWFRDFIGTPQFQTPGNLVLSSYPLALAIEEGLADENGDPIDAFSVKSCDLKGRCGFYTYLQGTAMAAPHVSGVAALIIEAHGKKNSGGYSLDPDTVGAIIGTTATDHACPAGGVEIYTDEGRPAEFNAVCQGTTAVNGLYGEGIVDATAAVD